MQVYLGNIATRKFFQTTILEAWIKNQFSAKGCKQLVEEERMKEKKQTDRKIEYSE